MEEIWKDVKGYEGLYSISTLGNIKSLPRDVVRKNGVIQKNKERILKQQKLFSYLGIYLYNEKSERVSKMIHRLVAETFIPDYEDGLQVNHKDGDKFNNKLENLEWVTPSENIRHAIENKLLVHHRKYTDEQIMECYNVINTTNVPIKEACKQFNLDYTTFMAVLEGSNRKYLNIDIINRQNYNRKLSKVDLGVIRSMLKEGIDARTIAKNFNVNTSCINKINLK